MVVVVAVVVFCDANAHTHSSHACTDSGATQGLAAKALVLGCPIYSNCAQVARLRGACGVGVSDLQGGIALAAKGMGRLRRMQWARLGWLWNGHPIVVVSI